MTVRVRRSILLAHYRESPFTWNRIILPSMQHPGFSALPSRTPENLLDSEGMPRSAGFARNARRIQFISNAAVAGATLTQTAHAGEYALFAGIRHKIPAY